MVLKRKIHITISKGVKRGKRKERTERERERERERE